MQEVASIHFGSVSKMCYINTLVLSKIKKKHGSDTKRNNILFFKLILLHSKNTTSDSCLE